MEKYYHTLPGDFEAYGKIEQFFTTLIGKARKN